MFNLTFSSTQVLLGTGLLVLGLIGLYFFFKYYFNKKIKNPSLESSRTKYASADVFQYQPTFFKVGLLSVLAFTLMAFNWTQFSARTLSEPIVYLPGPDIIVTPRTVILPPPPPPPPPPPITTISCYFGYRETMPVFGKCSHETNESLRRDCSNRTLMTFIGNNVNYPVLARETGIEGTVVISFVIEKDGRMSSFEIVRDIGGGLGEEALRVAKLMADEHAWSAGKQRGRPVAVQFNLPVKFKLQ